MTPQQVQLLLTPCAPDPQRLVDVLRVRLDGNDLLTIALADMFDLPAHLAELQKLHATGRIPDPLKWNPREALDMVRWWDLEKDKRPNGVERTKAHTIRAFCCSVLLSAQCGVGGIDKAENSTVIQLVDSAIRLDEAVVSGVMSLLAHRIFDGHTSENDDLPLFSLGLLLLTINAGPAFATADRLLQLARLVEEEESRVRSTEWCTNADWNPPFLLGLTSYDTLHDRWRDLTRRFLVDQERPVPPAAADSLRLLGEVILN